MKFDLTLAVVLVFMVPGSVLILGVPVGMIEPLDALTAFSGIPSVAELVTLLALALLIGVLLDSLRTVTTQLLVNGLAKIFGSEGFPQDYVSSITSDRLVVFEMLVRRSYEYYRLNCNLALALLVLVVLQLFADGSSSRLVGLAVALSVWVAVSVRSKIDNDAAVRQFAKVSRKSVNKGEETMCQGLPCVGAQVRLTKDYSRDGVRCAAGTIGIVQREFLATRELEVRFETAGEVHYLRVAEFDVDVIQRPEPRRG